MGRGLLFAVCLLASAALSISVTVTGSRSGSSWNALNLVPDGDLSLSADIFDNCYVNGVEVQCSVDQVLGARFPAWAVLGWPGSSSSGLSFALLLTSVSSELRSANLLALSGLSATWNTGAGENVVLI